MNDWKAGDIVRFERASLPENRVRDYKIETIHPHGISVTASSPNLDFEHSYSFTHEQIKRLGMVRAPGGTE